MGKKIIFFVTLSVISLILLASFITFQVAKSYLTEDNEMFAFSGDLTILGQKTDADIKALEHDGKIDIKIDINDMDKEGFYKLIGARDG